MSLKPPHEQLFEVDSSFIAFLILIIIAICQ